MLVTCGLDWGGKAILCELFLSGESNHRWPASETLFDLTVRLIGAEMDCRREGDSHDRNSTKQRRNSPNPEFANTAQRKAGRALEGKFRQGSRQNPPRVDAAD